MVELSTDFLFLFFTTLLLRKISERMLKLGFGLRIYSNSIRRLSIVEKLAVELSLLVTYQSISQLYETVMKKKFGEIFDLFAMIITKN